MLLVALTLLAGPSATAQDLVVAPYLQHPTGSSVRVMWETDDNATAEVAWGSTDALGETATGTSSTGSGRSQVHTVQLSGLTPGERYWYQVPGGEVTPLTLPPGPGDDGPLSLVAMSDMQQDGSNPDKFEEIVQAGVIPFVTAESGEDLDLSLDLVLIAGDLVDWGWSYDEWAETFFAPAAPLFASVPSYPVPGNHEGDTPYFFTYFDLPESGSAGYLEHWWFADHANLRIIGLDSNSSYQLDAQLDWLDDVLADACGDDDLDFVLAQLHHPFLSELWLDGETAFTGDVITRLETFSTDCGKPSLHLFGHTHGYSRGQSQDHQHLWVNVASAGGNLDYWGEYAQADYDQFTISLDEYGFVLIDVQGGDDPWLRLRRIGRGDEAAEADNMLRDEVLVYRHGTAPETPIPRFPSGSDVPPDCVVLEADAFVDEADEDHGASQWQLSTACDDWSAPVLDRWVQHQNWYEDVDTQADDLLIDEQVEGLASDAEYCWRVRYRDRGLAWSAWSEGMSFTTGGSELSEQLLENGGAEEGTDGWEVLSGVFEALESEECGGISPYAGKRYFAVGGLCTESDSAEVQQQIAVSDHAHDIDGGAMVAHASAWMADWSGSDLPQAWLAFLDADGAELGLGPVASHAGSTWTAVDFSADVPPDTRTIAVHLAGTRYAGTDNDSYVDEVSLRIGATASDCARWDGVVDDGGDGGTTDGGLTDGGLTDGGTTDGGTTDGGLTDGGLTDGGADGGEAGTPKGTGCSCVTGVPSPALWWLLPLLASRRRR